MYLRLLFLHVTSRPFSPAAAEAQYAPWEPPMEGDFLQGGSILSPPPNGTHPMAEASSSRQSGPPYVGTALDFLAPNGTHE